MFWSRVGIAAVELKNLQRHCKMLCKKARKARYIYNPINKELSGLYYIFCFYVIVTLLGCLFFGICL